MLSYLIAYEIFKCVVDCHMSLDYQMLSCVVGYQIPYVTVFWKTDRMSHLARPIALSWPS